MGKQIYFTSSEIEALCELFNSFDEISPDEETYAYWLKRTGTAQYKIFNAKERMKNVRER